jgi:hypothetical protein
VDVVIWGKTTTPGINFCFATYGPNPSNQMLQKSLVQLVQDIWGYGVVDVNKGKNFPKYALDRFDSSTCAGLCKCSCALFNRIKGFYVFVSIPWLTDSFSISNLIVWCWADGTFTLCEPDEGLLGVITNISCKDWEAPPCRTISAGENDSFFSSPLQWLDNILHTVMKQIGQALSI